VERTAARRTSLGLADVYSADEGKELFPGFPLPIALLDGVDRSHEKALPP